MGGCVGIAVSVDTAFSIYCTMRLSTSPCTFFRRDVARSWPVFRRRRGDGAVPGVNICSCVVCCVILIDWPWCHDR